MRAASRTPPFQHFIRFNSSRHGLRSIQQHIPSFASCHTIQYAFRLIRSHTIFFGILSAKQHPFITLHTHFCEAGTMRILGGFLLRRHALISSLYQHLSACAQTNL